MLAIDEYNNISIVQGNTATIDITPLDDDDKPVIMENGDKIIFSVKSIRKTLITKVLTADMQDDEGYLTLEITPEDTLYLPPDKYYYDCLFIAANGEAYTFIGKAIFEISKAISRKDDVT